MTIKELQEAKIKLDKELTDSVRSIVDSFFKTNGIAPGYISVNITPRNIYIDTQVHPVSTELDVNVESKFMLA